MLYLKLQKPLRELTLTEIEMQQLPDFENLIQKKKFFC